MPELDKCEYTYATALVAGGGVRRGLEPPPSAYECVSQIGPGFWNYRGVWKYRGLINIGSQMSAIQLENGNFLVIDVVELTPEIKTHLDAMTNLGARIEALILTHPFHVAHFKEFIQAYPRIDCYGTPRHLRKFPDMDWKGVVTDCRVRSLWYPEIEMRIPEGAEFIRPLPERDNHLCGMWLYHAASRTVHQNDTIMVGHKPNILLKIDGYRHLKMKFHQSITTCGLFPTPEAPLLFRDWLVAVLRDWEFDNMAAGHMGSMIGGAKAEMTRLVRKSEGLFQHMRKRFKKHGKISFVANGKYSLNIQDELFDSNNLECECG